MIRTTSGCSRGSPPLRVMIAVPSAAKRSIRPSISAVGTGFEKSSYSLQYAHERLQRRMGMICASTGCFGDFNALAIIRASRTRRLTARTLRLKATTFMDFLLYRDSREHDAGYNQRGNSVNRIMVAARNTTQSNTYGYQQA